MDFSSYDDSMGESFGTGLDSSALDLSGSDALSLDYQGEVPMQGGDLSLDWSDGSTYSGGVGDLAQGGGSFWDDMSLSGVSDPAPSWDASGFSWNGSGSADSSYHSGVDITRNISGISDMFSSVAKFGASIGSLLNSPSQPATLGRSLNQNPNRSSATSISGSHATVLVVVVVLLIGAVALGGSNGR